MALVTTSAAMLAASSPGGALKTLATRTSVPGDWYSRDPAPPHALVQRFHRRFQIARRRFRPRGGRPKLGQVAVQPGARCPVQPPLPPRQVCCRQPLIELALIDLTKLSGHRHRERDLDGMPVDLQAQPRQGVGVNGARRVRVRFQSRPVRPPDAR